MFKHDTFLYLANAIEVFKNTEAVLQLKSTQK